MGQEHDNAEAQNMGEASTMFQSSENNEKETGNPGAASNIVESEDFAGPSNKSQASQKRTPRKLRARPRAFKKPSDSKSLEEKSAKGTGEGRGKLRKKNKKSLPCSNRENNKNEDEDMKKMFREENVDMNVTDKEHIEEVKEIQKNGERTRGSRKRRRKQNKEGRHLFIKKSEEKHKVSYRNLTSQNIKQKVDGKESRQRDERKKEKLGGLIFMCNAKTKPDCFRFRVMGVSMGKKDLVLGVKPGLKLFLYDFDLKLMYGIYQASSFGGVRLEPKAFGGSFPAQVRFRVYKDCFPLSESVFKKAIKDNYYEKNKFNVELSVRQVRKLSDLFRPAVFQSQSATVPIHSSPVAPIQDRGLYEGVRDSRHRLDREVFAIAGVDGRAHPKMPRDLYMSEQEYRTYGLQGERRTLAPSQTITSTVDPYRTDQERELLRRQQDAFYRDSVTARESVLADPLYLTQREAQTYNLGAVRGLPTAVAPLVTATASSSAVAVAEPYTRDPYYSYHYGALSLDTYLPPPRREEVPSSSYFVDSKRNGQLVDTNVLLRRESDHVSQLYSKYAVEAPPSYSQLPLPQETRLQTLPASVSSRYSFAGPSLSYR